jgi:hypothetical protein
MGSLASTRDGRVSSISQKNNPKERNAVHPIFNAFL